VPPCFFATDLHGNFDRYEKLFSSIVRERPPAVFLGGDLLPRSSLSVIRSGQDDFAREYLIPSFAKIRAAMGAIYPHIFLILGNDDARCVEKEFVDACEDGIWHYVHGRHFLWRNYSIFGCSYVPPTPFSLKDWERYDVSRYVPPGAVSPEEGIRTIPADESEIKWGTIQKELGGLTGEDALEHSVFLFHSPPCNTPLDRAALDDQVYEHVQLDVHVGSIAIERFIEERQPLLTLHGHVHESARLTGKWKIRIGRTVAINAAHDGPELALVRFDVDSPGDATRQLL